MCTHSEATTQLAYSLAHVFAIQDTPGKRTVLTPREGWDHATGWMRRVLADVWHLDLKVVEAEFTLVGVNPALDQFTDLARELRREAEEQARRHGRELGAAVATAPPKAA